MIAVISLEHVAWLALLIACMALSALLSGMETGLYVLNKIRLDLRAEAGSRRARILRDLLSNPGDLLATLLVGNNIANYGATFAVSAMYLLSGAGGGKAEFYTLATVTPLLFVMCESIPKSVFQRLAETLVYRLAVLLSAIRLILNALGLVWMVQRLSHLLLRVLRVEGKGGGQPLRGKACCR